MAERIALVTFNVVPAAAATLKYTVLGPLATTGLRAYASQHGYALYDEAPAPNPLPACWGKFAALRQALDRHEWAVWVDSDALVMQTQIPLEPFLATAADVVAQDPLAWFRRTRLDPIRGRMLQPIHTAVFAVRRSPMGFALLDRAANSPRRSLGPRPWDGLGDQEAMATAVATLAAWDAIATVPGLQVPPGEAETGVFMHLFGDRGGHRYTAAACEAVVRRLVPATSDLGRDAAGLLHWCAIQCLEPNGPERGGPERFGYMPDRLDATMAAMCHGMQD